MAQQPTFSFLTGLKEFGDLPSAASKGDIGSARALITAGARKQRGHVTDLIAGKDLPKMAGGTKTVSTWWFKDASGYMCSIRYGQQPVPLNQDGKSHVRVGKDLDALSTFLDNVIAAVEKGELDEALKRLQDTKSVLLKAAHEKARKAKEEQKAAEASKLTQDVAKELDEAA